MLIGASALRLLGVPSPFRADPSVLRWGQPPLSGLQPYLLSDAEASTASHCGAHPPRWGGTITVNDCGGDCCAENNDENGTMSISAFRLMGIGGGTSWGGSSRFSGLEEQESKNGLPDSDKWVLDVSAIDADPWSSQLPTDLPSTQGCLYNPHAFHLPSLSSTYLTTRFCFADEHGRQKTWPTSVACCPPLINPQHTCEPPSNFDALEMMLSVPTYGNRLVSYLPGVQEQQPTWSDGCLLGAGISILLENLDIVRWTACLVQLWSPEMGSFDLEGQVLRLLTRGSDGFFPFSVTYVERPVSGNRNATMWAFVNDFNSHTSEPQGLIVPLATDTWQSQVAEWESGGGTAFCAAVQVAATILHELVHIVADNYVAPNYFSTFTWLDLPGAKHEEDLEDDPVNGTDNPCWDEGRMISTMFLWLMSQRFSCLTDNAFCRNMSDDRYFAYSASTSYQLRGS